ncbi:pilus assembly protein PilM [bacterium]|nr:pilus assembly protein PilM [bacterium]
MGKKIQTTQPWPLVLGVDWGSPQSIKYVLIRRTAASRVYIDLFGRIPITAEGPESLYDAVQGVHELLLREKKARKAKLVLGLGTERLMLKKESLPPLSSKELHQAVLFGLQKDLDREGGDSVLVFDYAAVGKDPAVPENTEYLCIGAEESFISERANVFAGEGLIPIRITSNTLSLVNLLSESPSGIPPGRFCILDIGASRSVLSFYRDGQVDFQRELVIGGDDFTKAITGTIFHEGRAIQFTTKEALEFKYKYGYPLGFSEGMTFRGAPLSEIGAMMRPVMERLTGEIHRSIGFYKDKSGGEQVSSLMLIGGGAQLKHLSHALTERLGIPTTVAKPPAQLRISGGEKQEQKFRAQFLEHANALANALETRSHGVLLPAKYRKIHLLSQIRYYLNWAAVFMLTILAVLSITGYFQLHQLKSEEAVRNREAHIVANKLARYERNLSLKNAADKAVNLFEDKIRQDPRNIRLLRAITAVLPKTLSISQITIGKEKAADKRGGKPPAAKPAEGTEQTPNILTIKGDSRMSIPDIRMSVAQFLLDLSKSGYLTDVKLQDENTIEKTDEYLFTITAKLTY